MQGKHLKFNNMKPKNALIAIGLFVLFLSVLVFLLPAGDFIRIHRSCIVPISKIDYIEGNRVFVAGHEFPLGRQFKEALQKRLNLNP